MRSREDVVRGLLMLLVFASGCGGDDEPRPHECGDGVVDPGEGCDLGEANDDAGMCKTDCSPQMCGDGFVGPGEGCDDGNAVDDDDCTNECSLPTCGDGIVQEGEPCDDGNGVDDDGCTNACTLPDCGDGIEQAGEECDDGNASETDACLPDCVDASCGDGIVWEGVEECDDANLDNEDDCINSCEAASCGDGYVQRGVEECDDHDFDDTDDCLSTCIAPTCGDGFVRAGVEACDDGVNDGSYDGCEPGCMSLGPHCGDGEVQGREYCDDGNRDEEDGCNVDCTRSAEVLWTTTWDGSEMDEGYGIATDGDGNILVAGVSMSRDGDSDVFVGKFDPDGARVWNRIAAGGGRFAEDIGWGIGADSDGNVLVAGTLDGEFDEVTDQFVGTIWVRKYDPDGGIVWTRPEADRGRAFGLAVDPGGNVFVTGYVSLESLDVWVRKYDPDGAPVWTRTVDVDAGSNDWGIDVTVDGGGNVIVVGLTGEIGDSDVWVRKYDSDGATIWTRTFDGEAGGDDAALGVAVDSADDILVSGWEGLAGEDTRIWVRKYDSDGEVVWTRTHEEGGGGMTASYGVAVDADDNVAVVGTIEVGDENQDVWVRKYDPDGEPIWTSRYDSSGGIDIGTGVAVDPSGNVVVTGFVEDRWDLDVWIRKYAP